MPGRFEELAREETDAGTVTLRRRHDPLLDVDVLEVKLDDEFLMSSLFTAAEIELARLALAEASGDELHVVVGGLGLGYTALAALEDRRVASVTIVEALRPVIDWHERGLVSDAGPLVTDPRVTFLHGDFFALAGDEGFDPALPHRRYDVILLDIDHSPRLVLQPAHAAFYTAEGLRALSDSLAHGGVFALWSDEAPDADFGRVLDEVFSTWGAHVVTFPNPYTQEESSNTVYVARK